MRLATIASKVDQWGSHPDADQALQNNTQELVIPGLATHVSDFSLKPRPGPSRIKRQLLEPGRSLCLQPVQGIRKQSVDVFG